MKLTEQKLRNIVREEIQKVVQERNQLDEYAAFDEDKMEAFLEKTPKLQRIYNQSDNDLKTMWDKYVVPNAKMKRRYSHAN